MIRHVPSHTIDTDQLRVLLTYAEQALFDPKQQSIAFGVLKAILRRKLTLEELPDVMMRVAELSIKSEAVPVRAQSRKVRLNKKKNSSRAFLIVPRHHSWLCVCSAAAVPSVVYETGGYSF